jgi:hypothetical protein
VPSDRLIRILTLMRARGEDSQTATTLCQVCAEVVAVSGAGVMLMSGEVYRGSVCSSDEVSSRIEDLQYTLGEGPCVDAYAQDFPVLEPDLANPSEPRWEAFRGPALAAGARAVFGFPIRIGAIRLGAMNLYKDRPGTLSDGQHADAMLMAETAGRAVLAMQANAPPGALAEELEAGSDFHLVVHQASGMVAVQLGVSIAEALIRLRAYAFVQDCPLNDIAKGVVAHQLHIE